MKRKKINPEWMYIYVLLLGYCGGYLAISIFILITAKIIPNIFLFLICLLVILGGSNGNYKRVRGMHVFRKV